MQNKSKYNEFCENFVQTPSRELLVPIISSKFQDLGLNGLRFVGLFFWTLFFWTVGLNLFVLELSPCVFILHSHSCQITHTQLKTWLFQIAHRL